MIRARKLIGVIISDVTGEWEERILTGIIEQAREYDFNVAVFSSYLKNLYDQSQNEGEKNIYHLPSFEYFDGIIFVPDSIPLPSTVHMIEKRLEMECKCPILCLSKYNSSFAQIPIQSLEEDFKAIINHFIIDHNFRKISILAGPKNKKETKSLLNGLKVAFNENQIPIEGTPIYYGDLTKESGVNFVEELISQKTIMPQVIVCGNDCMAAGVCETLKKYNYRVPEDVCVSGYGNKKIARHTIPSITSFFEPLEQLGRYGVDYLRDKIFYQNVSDHKFPPPLTGEVMKAESCGCTSLEKTLEPSSKLVTAIGKKRSYQQDLEEVKCEFIRMNVLEENLITSSNQKEFLNRLYHHLNLLKGYQDFYLCLCDDWDSLGKEEEDFLKEGYTEKMELALAVKDGKKQPSGSWFSVDQMLPVLYEKNEPMKAYYFNPLHFRDRCFGYAVVSYEDQIKTFDYVYRAWLKNINNSLESIRTRNQLLWYNNCLERIAEKDELTGIFNRWGFRHYANEIFESNAKHKKPFKLIIGDLDNLKVINDTYGHLEGDIALKVVADAFDSIKTKGAVCSRIGGDEFIIVFDGDYSEDQIAKYLKDIYIYLEDYNDLQLHPYKVCTSLGMYYDIPDKSTTLQDCINIADKRMYDIKNKKKNKCIRRFV